MMGIPRSRFASVLPMLALWVVCAALLHCVQIQDPEEGVKRWGEAVQIDEDGTAPEIAIDPAGKAVVVWTRPDGFWSRRWVPGSSWLAAERIPSASDTLPTAAVGIDGGGNAVAVWSQFLVGEINVFSNRCAPGLGWGDSERIDDDVGEALPPQVSVNADGSAVAVWAQFDGTRDGVWSARYTVDSGWDDPQRIESNTAIEASGPQIAVDPSGNAVAVWAHRDGLYDIWSNLSTPTGVWRTNARVVETADEGNASGPSIGMDDQGNAIAVWHQSDRGQETIWSARYTPPVWGIAERIDKNKEGDASDPHVAVAQDGSALAVWVQFDGAKQQVWSARYTPASDWGIPERIEVNDGGGSSLEPRVAVALDGTAVAVWQQLAGSASDIWSARYTPSGGWGRSRRIDTDDGGVGREARVATDPAGNALAVWAVFGGSSPGVWSNRLASSSE